MTVSNTLDHIILHRKQRSRIFNKNTGVVQLATSSGNAVTGTISNATLCEGFC